VISTRRFEGDAATPKPYRGRRSWWSHAGAGPRGRIARLGSYRPPDATGGWKIDDLERLVDERGAEPHRAHEWEA